MVAREVEGLPHDLERANLNGPIIELEVIRRVNPKYGETCTAKLWTDSAEVVKRCQEERVSMLSSQSSAWNVHMLLKQD